MALIQLIGAATFINRLTANRLNERQVNRSIAYIRANKACFYDNWSKEQCMLLNSLEDNKAIVIRALKAALNAQP